MLADGGTFKNKGTHMISQVEVVRTAVRFVLREKEGDRACCLDLKTRRVGVPGRRGNKERKKEGALVHRITDDKPCDDKP